MEHLSSAMGQQQQYVQWRRDKVQELCSKGYSQREISQTLQIGLATVNRDIAYLRNQAYIPSHGINHIKHNLEYGYQLMNLIERKRRRHRIQ
jgi:Trp operon repressor